MIYRELDPSEYELLKAFTYEAIFIPDGMEPPDRSITEMPELSLYYAVSMYKKAGFRTVSENDEEFIMICGLT